METNNEQITRVFEEVKFSLEMLVKAPEFKNFYTGKIDGILRVLNALGLTEQLNEFLEGNGYGN